MFRKSVSKERRKRPFCYVSKVMVQDGPLMVNSFVVSSSRKWWMDMKHTGDTSFQDSRRLHLLNLMCQCY